MSPRQNGIQALERAIMEEARGEADQILTDARTEAQNIRRQAQAQADAEREAILQRAQRETQDLHDHTSAAAQLEAQTLKLQRRERLLERVFDAARQKLVSAPEWPDYEQVVHQLVREAVERLGAGEVVVKADGVAQKMLGDTMLAELERELNARLHLGESLTQSTGVVVETPDGHRQVDSTLETRLARMRQELRTPVYHILLGETQ